MEPTLELLFCPVCNGFGYSRTPAGTAIACETCSNRDGIVALYDDDVIVWHTPLAYSSVRRAKVQQVFEYILDTALMILGVGGILSLFSVLFELTGSHQTFTDLLSGLSVTRLIFWVSLLGDLELYYRMKRALERTKIIKPLHRLRELPSSNGPRNWEWYRHSAHDVRIDAAQFCQGSVRQVIRQAQQLAHKLHSPTVAPAHLMLALLETNDVLAALYRLELYVPDFKAACARIVRRDEAQHMRVTEALIRAYCEARANKRAVISVLELLIGCITADPLLQAALGDQGITELQLRHVIHWGNAVNDLQHGEQQRQHLAKSKPKSVMNRAMTARPTKVLDSISQDFTLLARANRFLPPIGRDREVAEAFRVLQEGHSSVLLLGEPGVGKSTILEGIAELMTSENVPEALQDKRLVVTDPGALIAGAGNIGGLEERMEQVIGEIVRAGNVIWAIEDIHTLLGAGQLVLVLILVKF